MHVSLLNILVSIRTMSRARAAPPTNLLVEPINQTSVEVRWRPAVESGEESPLSYEVDLFGFYLWELTSILL